MSAFSAGATFPYPIYSKWFNEYHNLNSNIQINYQSIGSGGGIAEEGEDIEVLELPIEQALAMIDDGRIVDAKTIILLQYAALNIFK